MQLPVIDRAELTCRQSALFGQHRRVAGLDYDQLGTDQVATYATAAMPQKASDTLIGKAIMSRRGLRR